MAAGYQVPRHFLLPSTSLARSACSGRFGASSCSLGPEPGVTGSTRWPTWGSLLYFYAILLGFSRLTPEEGRFLDPGPLLLVFTAFNLTLFTFQSIAYTVQGEAQLGTLEHMALAREASCASSSFGPWCKAYSGFSGAFWSSCPWPWPSAWP